MKKQYRVKKSTEIENIIKNKRFYSNKYFTVYRFENSEAENFRYAISVGKKIGNAVVRNKIKRQIRAIVDNYIDVDQNVIDVFIVARPAVKEIEFAEMQDNLIYLLKKSNLKNKRS